MRTFIVVGVLTASLAAQPQAPKPIPLWADGAPGALGTADEDTPTITPYLAPTARSVGTAVIVCPGGGYLHLSMEKEGSDVARWCAGQLAISGSMLTLERTTGL